ncbi:predicted protein [Postia placenta Mad-698-R]|uniref:Uncharacterized protein n=1 Tax=Postia placenta MAD-698-R-SB12 TaxID=670580 RepID=A0A1X6N033_9APHY|nr:hypothetical protein POSPLADRAFT_1145338 [Postia placenta MAD-698-R-SB12]EED79479.1 predicted protein [Postia placenta Mad-698-R]OSX61852.1 hypothetical protein POSPLADRAFT_1145338 [Postia placenta MAD-698-R-SB12]
MPAVKKSEDAANLGSIDDQSSSNDDSNHSGMRLTDTRGTKLRHALNVRYRLRKLCVAPSFDEPHSTLWAIFVHHSQCAVSSWTTLGMASGAHWSQENNRRSSCQERARDSGEAGKSRDQKAPILALIRQGSHREHGRQVRVRTSGKEMMPPPSRYTKLGSKEEKRQ